MKPTRFNEQQIISILKEAEAGVPVLDLCRNHAIGKSTFYKWRSKYGGLELSEAQRLKALELENQRLKRMYAELSLEHQGLKEIVEKKLERVSERQRCWLLGLSRSVYRYQAQARNDAALESALQVPAAPNKCWSLDFMSDTLPSEQRFRTLNIIDDFNRELLWGEIDVSLPASRVVRVLEPITQWPAVAPGQRP